MSRGNNVRLADGTIANTSTDLVTGTAGFAFELGRDSELQAGSARKATTSPAADLPLYSGTPTGFGYVKVDYHAVDLDTPTAVHNRADTDSAILGVAGQLWYGVWGHAGGHYDRYGVHGDANVARTAGWDAGLRWDTPVWDGLLVGLSYDGHGDYRTSKTASPAPRPRPLCRWASARSRTMPSPSTSPAPSGNGFWFSGYAGWVKDRYASDGLLAGLDLHYTPAPGVDLALGVRQSAVSYIQGETGRPDHRRPEPDPGHGRAAPAQLDAEPRSEFVTRAARV